MSTNNNKGFRHMKKSAWLWKAIAIPGIFAGLALVCPSPGFAEAGRQTPPPTSISSPLPKGPYFGQRLPGEIPEIFAPEFLSARFGFVARIAFSPDGAECFFTVPDATFTHPKIYGSRKAGDTWSEPAIPAFADPRWKNLEPFFSGDGAKLYFISNRDAQTDTNKKDIWAVERNPKGWGEPRRLPAPFNSEHVDSFFSQAADGTAYFCSNRPGGMGVMDLYRVRPEAKPAEPAENLRAPVNTPYYTLDPCIAPDKRFLVFASVRPEGRGRTDLYASFDDGANGWTAPVNLGEGFNTPADEYAPSLSPDGRFLFFTRHDGKRADLHWVRASVLERFRPQALAPARIEAVENSLKPALYEKGRTPAAMNILDRMKHYHVPGVSVAVINEGKIEWAKGYGVKEIGGQGRITPDTLFQAASISKPVTALGVLSLVEKGILDLDAPVNDKLVSWKVPENEFTKKEKVTLRRLLTHSAGLTVSGFPGYAASDPIPTPVQVLNGEKPATTLPVRVDAVPGSQWRYSGGGFLVTQVLTADVSGRPFPEYIKKTVLDPLGMDHSAFEQPLPSDKSAQAASGHEMNGEAVKGKWHIYPELAAAGLWTTPSDLCRVAIEIEKSVAGESQIIISREMAEKMLAPGAGNWGLGIGLGAPTTEERRSFSPGGGNKGFSCMLFAFVHKGQGAVIMTNSDNGNGLVTEILRGLSSVYGWAIMQPKEISLVKIVPEKLVPYAGDYRSSDASDAPVLVSIEGDQLHLKSTDIGDWALSPVSETEFVCLDGGDTVTFVKGSDGRYDQIKLWGSVYSRKKG